MGWVGTVSSKMDWERLPVALLYADVRAYCSHVKMYCKRARLLSSHPLLFIIHSFKVKYSQAWVDTVDSETVEPQFTDSSLLRKVFFSSGEALTISLNSVRWRIPVNAENAYLLLSQSTDYHRRLTSLMRTLCSQKYAENLQGDLFFFDGKEKTFSLQHVDVPSGKVHRIGRFIEPNWISDYFGIKRVMQITVLHIVSNIWMCDFWVFPCV